jgi:predicted GNAT superfamily acetyltransferase
LNRSDLQIHSELTAKELRSLEELQIAVWQYPDREVVPADLMIALQRVGALIATASEGAEPIGFVLGLPTTDSKHQHSHMLGVRPDRRRQGVGLALKRYQAAWCLARGITKISWTFDPLRLANAKLNLHQLGAIGTAYLPDFYGEMGGINSGIPSDRLWVEWRPGEPRERAELQAIPVWDESWPPRPDLGLSAALLKLALPGDLEELRAEDLPRLEIWQSALRAAMVHYLASGYTVWDLGEEPSYLLRRS